MPLVSETTTGPEGMDAPPVPMDARSVPTERVTHRFRLVTTPLPPARPVMSLTGERLLIIGGSPVALSLAKLLEARGARPDVVAPATSEEALAAVERAENASPVRHLILTTPSAGGNWLARKNRWIEAPYFACQRWIATRIAAGELLMSSLTAVTDLGGDFGLGGDVGSVEGGALTGLVKGLAREFCGLRVRAVDFSPTMAFADVAAVVWDELGEPDGPVEVGHRGHRLAITPVPAEPSAMQDSAHLPKPGDLWLITGGARGVTAACAAALGRAHAVRLVLVGSTEPMRIEPDWLALDAAGRRALGGKIMVEARERSTDPRLARQSLEKSLEIAVTLEKLKASGIDARYVACNLGNAAAVEQLIDQITRDLGPIRGLVHGAGFESASSFGNKTIAGLRATLGPKAAGLWHLLQAIAPESLRHLMAFGSTSGRLGGYGQADYSLANDLMAKLVDRFRRSTPSCRSTVFHWPAWDEVGMATRPESRFALERFGIRFMPLAEGVGHFLAELEAGLSEPEVLIADPARIAAVVPSSPTTSQADDATAPER